MKEYISMEQAKDLYIEYLQDFIENIQVDDADTEDYMSFKEFMVFKMIKKING